MKQSSIPYIPRVYPEFIDYFKKNRQACCLEFQSNSLSFIPNLLPQSALKLTDKQLLSILRKKLGQKLDIALSEENIDPCHSSREISPALQSPVSQNKNSHWLKKANMVGINIRTIGSFWNVLKYNLTLPQCQDSLHLLPIWEPGVVGSLYGMSSWQINPEFFDENLVKTLPALNSVEKQLKAVINILHALGKTVGMDVIPHTDRFSEIVLMFPCYFEWIQREDTVIIDQQENLHLKVEKRIFQFILEYGPADPDQSLPAAADEFFAPDFDEKKRRLILFGPARDQAGREKRRNELVRFLYAYGYEPVPATMAPPYRGLKVNIESKNIDGAGMIWRDYLITQPQSMSRVFGPLGRYKLYRRKNNNKNWQIDFDQPIVESWQFVCEHYYQIQDCYGFDFMRGDMSHVQMRPQGVPEKIDGYYDIHKAVKSYIQQHKNKAYFGYFAETFLAPRDIMAFGDEIDHLEASDADTTLGDLQSTAVGSTEFLQRFRLYLDILQTRSFAPNFTILTGDKDDPRFDSFFLKGNELRYFSALFLTDMPSYMALGFETRDVHYTAAPNEHYTKLYVFQESQGPKATHGPYQMGKNGILFHYLLKIKLYAEKIWSQIRNKPVAWLLYPDSTANTKYIAWTHQTDPRYVFVANTDTQKSVKNFNIPAIKAINSNQHKRLALDFSLFDSIDEENKSAQFNGYGYKIASLLPGEVRVYRIEG